MKPSNFSDSDACLVVVDGGGSSCTLELSTASQVVRRVKLDSHASLSLGVKSAWANISAGLAQLAADTGRPTGWLPQRLFMGLAGSLQQQKCTQFLALLPASVECAVTTDGHAQLVGATAGEPGVCLSVGTGSVLHWLDAQRQSGMAGGWGFPVGDEGSGAWLGFELLRHYIWHQDGRRSRSVLMDRLATQIGTDRSGIEQWTTRSRSTAFASLAPMIFDAADEKDALALELLEQGVACCQRLLQLAPADLPLYIAGSIGDRYRSYLDHAPRKVQSAAGDALSGLRLMANRSR